MVPETVSILSRTIAIETASNMSDLGEIWLARDVIRLRDDQSDASLRDTLLHEIMHALLNLSGLTSHGVLEDANVAEHVISSLAPLLLDTFRRNPEVVKFLFETGGESHADRKANS